MKGRRQSALRCVKALAVPVTYLILFVSLIVVISTTYGFAVVKISAKGALVRVSVAKEDMMSLDDAIRTVAWTYGASERASIENCGGTFKMYPSQMRLVLNITDEQTINEEVFNSNIGKALIELEPSELNEAGQFLRGDSRPIVNQTTSTMTQLRFASSETSEIVLNYRPIATATTMGSHAEKPSNIIRVSILNLNSSRFLALKEKTDVTANSLNVTMNAFQYEFNQSISSLAMKADLDGISGIVWLPVSSNENGAIVTVQIVVCNVRIQSLETQ